MIEVLEKRIVACHVDGEPSLKRIGVVQELCIQADTRGYRWLMRDSIRDGGKIGDFGGWKKSKQAALADYKKGA